MRPLKYVTSGLAALAIGGAVAFAPVAGAALLPAPVAASASAGDAGTDPLVPFGTEPQIPNRLGYVDSSHDEIDTTNGEVDLPF